MLIFFILLQEEEGHERRVMSQDLRSPWDWLPSVGPWFHAGKNSTVSHSKVKACLFRKLHIPKAEHSLSQKVRGPLGETHSTECRPSEKARGPRVPGCQFLCAQMLSLL